MSGGANYVNSLLLGLLFSSLDASIVSTSLVSISIDLEDFVTVPWVALSYMLAYLGKPLADTTQQRRRTLTSGVMKGFAVAFSKLSDIYGRRALVELSWLLFGGFSLGCGLAQNMTQLYDSMSSFRLPPPFRKLLTNAKASYFVHFRGSAALVSIALPKLDSSRLARSIRQVSWGLSSG